MIVNGFHRLSSPAIIDTGTRKGFDLDEDPGITYGPMPGWVGRQKIFDNSFVSKAEETMNRNKQMTIRQLLLQSE